MIRINAFVLMVMSCVLVRAGAQAETAGITVLSSQPGLVSGGDALVAVGGDGPVTLNGADVTGAFNSASDGKRIGLVEGLKLGVNILKAGDANLRLTNHPISGPVFSGPHETPLYCMTDKFTLPASKETLGVALDADCSVKTRVDFVYRTKGGAFKPLSAGARPDDLAETNTSDGKTVPYIVRVETGTINRAIYQIAILADPTVAVGPTAPPRAWNKKLVYTFGGGCVGGWYMQGASLGNRGILEDLMLRQGYAVASSTLNVFGNNCAMVLAAETLEMVKERFIKSYGAPKFTIGVGCSGGSEQLHPIGDVYPGLVDGMIVGCSFPEVIGGVVLNLTDADLMAHYFAHTPMLWSNQEQAAATGYPNATTAGTLTPLAVRIKAEGGDCNAVVPEGVRFSRSKNPNGVRCDVYDHAVNIFGKDPKTGAARRSWDNIGVQYGLAALKFGAISAQQFLDLNRAIGGFDNDGNYSVGRGEADPVALKRTYESGQVTYGGMGLKSTPIIDYRGYVDAPENPNENHSRFHSFSMRARLEKANGSAANQVMLVESGLPGTRGLFSDESPVLIRALTQMDEWLSNLNAGSGVQLSLAAIAKAKPVDLTDACFTDRGTVKIAETQVYRGDTKCNKLYPAYSTPRMVAGEPLTNNVLKCQLKPMDAADYGDKLGKNDLVELTSIFPKGVCDYSKPGMGQVPTKATWQSF
jgi:Tannase-like family of unknown function (DUF6351)